MKNKGIQWVLYPGAFLGSAAMNSSADDLYKWIKVLRNGEIVSEDTYELMIEENSSGYGMGFFTNNVACFHTGNLGSYVSYMGFARDTDFVVITISNTYNEAADFSEMSVLLRNIAMEY